MTETASAVMSFGSEKQYFDFNKPSDQKNLARLLANWSPSFIQNWFDGKIIQQWYRDNNISQEKQQEWNKIFTPFMVKYLIVHNLTDPINSLNRIKYNLETVLTDQNIANQLDWSVEEVKSMFTFFDKKHAALNSGLDPLEALKKIKYNLETVLTDQNIADQLNLPLDKVQTLFTPFLRKYVAVHHIMDPLASLSALISN